MIDLTGTKLLVIGDINVDLILPINTLPKKDLQVAIDKFWFQVGGSSAICALAASKLGCDTTFMGLLGDDFFSTFLINEMTEAGVNCKIKQEKEESAGVTCALVSKDMRRSMISYEGSNSRLSIGDIDFSHVNGDLLHIGGFNLLDSLRKHVHEIFRYATKKKILTSLDPNWDPKGWTKERVRDLHEILKVTNFFFPDYKEGKAITKLTEPKKIVSKLLEYCSGIVVLKLGEKGCLVGRGSDLFSVKAFKVKAIQTTGAGDEFNAAFLSHFMKTHDLRKSAIFANAAGAIYTTRIGRDRFPTEETVKEFIGKAKL